MSLEQRLLEDIKKFFSNEFKITLADLQKPTYVFVRDFYVCLLMEFEVDTENLRKATHFVNDSMEDCSPEITGDLNLVAAINYTFKFLNFGLFDLLNPGDNQKRTVSLISSALEFTSMADGLTSTLDFDGYKDKKDEVIRQLQQLEEMRVRLTELALSKDRLVQSTLSMKNEMAKTKFREQELCSEASAAAKEASDEQKKLEEKKETLKAKKAQLDQLKNSINRLKDELMGAQTLELKEQENNKVEIEKVELEKKYLDKVAAKKKYVTFVEEIKPFIAATEEVSQLFDENRIRQEEILSIQKETADCKQIFQTKQKELSCLQNEIDDLEKKLEQMKADRTNINAELTKKSAVQTKKSSELIKAAQEINEVIAISEQKLGDLKTELEKKKQMLHDFFQNLKNEVRKHVG